MAAEPLRELSAVVRAEWGKAWSVPAAVLWLGIAVVIALVTAMTLANDVVHAVSTGELPPGTRTPVSEVLGPVVSFAQIAVAGFALHLVTPEYAAGSIGPVFLATPRRWMVVAAKTAVAGAVAATLGAVLGPVSALLADAVLGGHAGTPVPMVHASAGAAGGCVRCRRAGRRGAGLPVPQRGGCPVGRVRPARRHARGTGHRRPVAARPGRGGVRLRHRGPLPAARARGAGRLVRGDPRPGRVDGDPPGCLASGR
ncbi:hypothetical protein APR04_003032 [Promicromonospora umidemergens]|nr:hypothetical protein [Promicromonospora umidemergens]